MPGGHSLGDPSGPRRGRHRQLPMSRRFDLVQCRRRGPAPDRCRPQPARLCLNGPCHCRDPYRQCRALGCPVRNRHRSHDASRRQHRCRFSDESPGPRAPVVPPVCFTCCRGSSSGFRVLLVTLSFVCPLPTASNRRDWSARASCGARHAHRAPPLLPARHRRNPRLPLETSTCNDGCHDRPDPAPH
ncbi:hypothetical protein P3T25_008556 [Paraburkholderia sp. GAS32]